MKIYIYLAIALLSLPLLIGFGAILSAKIRYDHEEAMAKAGFEQVQDRSGYGFHWEKAGGDK